MKILFISHDASLSGAPKLLRSLAALLKTDFNFETDFLLLRGGVASSYFKELGSVTIVSEKNSSFYEKVKYRLIDKRKYHLSKINYNSYNVIIANTVYHSEILLFIRKRYSGIIATYVHELKHVISFILQNDSSENFFSLSNLFFVPGYAVANDLSKVYNLDINKIKVLPYFIPSTSTKNSLNQGDYFTVGGCGTVEVRKGTDVFIQVARIFKEKYPGLPVKFIWQGADFNSLDYQVLLKDIAVFCLDDILSFRKTTTDIGSFYNELDLFLLTSREDAYPLVVLEAADASVPSICFKNSGGAVEFIAEDAGIVVDYLCIDEAAEAIYSYYINRGLLALHGSNAKVKLQQKHQNRKLVRESFLKAISDIRET